LSRCVLYMQTKNKGMRANSAEKERAVREPCWLNFDEALADRLRSASREPRHESSERGLVYEVMLVQPRHPDSVPSRSSHSSTRPGLPLARSSSTAAAAATHMASARQPLGAIQPLVPTRSGSGALAAQQQQHQEVQKLQQQTRRSTSPPEPRPSAPPQAPPPAQAQKDKEKEKARSKLSEQWADPPKRVRREDVWLDRRHLLGEVSTPSFSHSPPVRAELILCMRCREGLRASTSASSRTASLTRRSKSLTSSSSSRQRQSPRSVVLPFFDLLRADELSLLCVGLETRG
jgi:hypothetical protein